MITQLQVGDTIITDSHVIRQEQKNFYQQLYSNEIDHKSSEYKKAMNSFLDNPSISPLNEESQILCDSNITEKEILKSLKEQKMARHQVQMDYLQISIKNSG